MGVADVSMTTDQYLNLAMINLGEAVTEMANRRQRGAAFPDGFANVKLSLRRALSALDGVPWPGLPPDPQHTNKEDRASE
jgi:hypothetical protein